MTKEEREKLKSRAKSWTGNAAIVGAILLELDAMEAARDQAIDEAAHWLLKFKELQAAGGTGMKTTL